MKRILTLTVNNRTGVLNRITGLFTKRNFNIESIAVGTTEVEGVSRITLVVHAEQETEIEQMTKQLNKQIDVLKVVDITNQAIVARELALIKVTATPTSRLEISGIVNPFRAHIIDVSKDTMIVEVTGQSDKIEAIIDLLRPYGIKEIVRTGTAAFTRGTQKPTQNKTISII